MPKLKNEITEAMSMNKCYRQNIHGIFCNYKNVVNVSKDLYTKVEEVLTQFKKNMMLNIFIQLISGLLLKKVKNIPEILKSLQVHY